MRKGSDVWAIYYCSNSGDETSGYLNHAVIIRDVLENLHRNQSKIIQMEMPEADGDGSSTTPVFRPYLIT